MSRITLFPTTRPDRFGSLFTAFYRATEWIDYAASAWRDGHQAEAEQHITRAIADLTEATAQANQILATLRSRP